MVCAGSSQECGEAAGLASAGGESDLWTRWSDILKTWDKRQKTANIKVIPALPTNPDLITAPALPS